MQNFLSGLLLIVIFLVDAYAANFKVGETIFVAYPAGNIKDDAFIIGRIKGINENGDYRLSVIEFVEGHDYGLSCVPMVKNLPDTASIYGSAWDLWQDTTTLETAKLDYLVKQKDVMKLLVGKHFFIEHNNIFIVFGRWKSDAPMLTLDRLERAKREAAESQILEILPALQIAKLYRVSFYDKYERPYQPYETIMPLNKLLDSILKLFSEDKALKAIWMSKNRNWKEISANTKLYFLIEAIDKVVDDAHEQLYEEGIYQAGQAQLASFKEKLAILKHKK